MFQGSRKILQRHGPLMLKVLPTLAHVALIASITLAVPGCNKERSYPVHRENPAPKDALPIVIRVHDAPVDVPVPSVFVTYEIDPLCLPPVNNWEGCSTSRTSTRLSFRHSASVPLNSAVLYSTMAWKLPTITVAARALGHPCSWKLHSPSSSMIALSKQPHGLHSQSLKPRNSLLPTYIAPYAP